MGRVAYSLLGFTVILLGVYLWLQPPSASNEILFTGGTIVTMEANPTNADAVLVRDGRIITVGTLEKAMSASYSSPEIIDLAGKTLLPGFIEPHTHPLATAMLGAAIDVSGFQHSSRAQVIASLKAGIEEGGINGWIMAYGWAPVMLPDLHAPTLHELDELSPDKPLVILTQMMHDAYANSAALSAAGITSNSEAPSGSEFVKDEEGNLTGTIREIGAIAELFKAIPAPPDGAHAFLLSQQYKKYAKAGYTTIGILGPVGRAADPIGLIKTIGSKEHSQLRIQIYGLPNQIEGMSAPEDNSISTPIIGVKFWMDGSPFAGGAAFAEPYENTPLTSDRLHLAAGHIGATNYTEKAFQKEFEAYHLKGFQIAVHAQGETAVDRILDVAETVLKKHPRIDHRHRLEHNALITESQLKRALALGFTTSFFIDHISYYGHALPQLVGERSDRYMPIKTALKVGHKATVHTDNPATPIDALRAMQTLRMREALTNGAILGNDEKLSPIEALEAMTINAAWQLGLEKDTGSIAVGKSADFTILSQNPLTTTDSALTNTTVEGTWLKGQPVDTRTIEVNTVSLGFNILKNVIMGN
ncbi:MAG: amidohydrolase [Kordiimonas sp.]